MSLLMDKKSKSVLILQVNNLTPPITLVFSNKMSPKMIMEKPIKLRIQVNTSIWFACYLLNFSEANK